jgi:hypothetical protein
MRCLSHIFIFKKHKCFKNYYSGMEKTQICYFCLRKIKKMSEKELISFDKEFSKIHVGSLSPEYIPILTGITE